MAIVGINLGLWRSRVILILNVSLCSFYFRFELVAGTCLSSLSPEALASACEAYIQAANIFLRLQAFLTAQVVACHERGLLVENNLKSVHASSVLRIRIRISRIHMFLGLPDPGKKQDPHSDPDPNPIRKRYGSPDPYQNFMDPQHCLQGFKGFKHLIGVKAFRANIVPQRLQYPYLIFN